MWGKRCKLWDRSEIGKFNWSFFGMVGFLKDFNSVENVVQKYFI